MNNRFLMDCAIAFAKNCSTMNVGLLSSLSVLVFSTAVWSKSEYFGLLDVRFAHSDADLSWLNGGLAPFRVDETSDEFLLGQAILFTRWELNDSHAIIGQANVYDDEGDTFGLAELYYQYTTELFGRNELQVKLGSYFPEISTENVGPGWTTQIPLSNSAINSWIGEEVRITGLQVGLTQHTANDWRWGGSLAAFINNDPTGAMLTWRGWALHDRQLRLGEQVPVTQLPSIGSDSGFILQAPVYEPFLEVDDQVGYSFSVFAEQRNGLQIKLYHYDNRADPLATRDGQYGWDTQFTHLGLTYAVPFHIKIFAQWLEGETMMGNPYNQYVKADFASWFVGLNKTFEDFHLNIRFDDFIVEDHDYTPGDNNDQDGSAWTLGLRYDINASVALITEYVDIDESKTSRMYFSLPAQVDYTLTQAAIQWRF